MRFPPKRMPEYREKRVVNKFLFFPKILPLPLGYQSQMRWLEACKIKQVWIECPDSGTWIDVAWAEK